MARNTLENYQDINHLYWGVTEYFLHSLFLLALLGKQYNQQQILSMVVVIFGRLVTSSPVVWDDLVLTNSKGNSNDVHDERISLFHKGCP